MDIDKAYAFAVDAASGYVHMLTTIVAGRDQSLQAVTTFQNEPPIFAGTESLRRPEPRIAPQVFGYVAISAFLGTTLTTISRGGEFENTFSAVCWLSIAWLVYGSVAYGICKVFRGCGTYVQTIATMYQILATAFVVGSVASVAILACARVASTSSHAFMQAGVFLENNKFVPYYVVHVLFLMIYMPLYLRRIQRLGTYGVIALILYPLIAACLGMIIVVALVKALSGS